MQQYAAAQPIAVHNNLFSRLTALLQTAPSMLVAGKTHGKSLMEVVINGDLTRASDGTGFRAFAMGTDGIKEHGRLFEVQNLQNMINAAAIWQVASVLVAQKHLVDISSKLEDIRTSIQTISQFLNNQRKARIQSTYDYLRQVYLAIEDGGFSSSVRTELESCERDLLEILCHLEQEYLQESDRQVDGDTFGTEDLTTNLVAKTKRLMELADDIALCLKTRIAAWHVLALYPGESQLKVSRQQSIQDSVDGLKGLVPRLDKAIEQDVSRIESFWNSTETLGARKAKVRNHANDAKQILESHIQTFYQSLRKTDQLLLKHDQPMRMLFEVDNGAILGVRQLG